MIAPETLLKLYPLEALRLQIQEVLKAPLKAAHLAIGKPVDLGNLKTGVEVSLDKSKAPLDLWDRMGTVSFEYDRIQMDTFVQGIDNKVAANFPIDPRSLFTAMLKPYSIPVGSDDVIDAAYTAVGNATIFANEASYRWVGQCICVIQQLGFEVESLFDIRSFTPPFGVSWTSANVKEVLTFYLNTSNLTQLPLPLTSTMFTLGDPVVNGPIADSENTSITLTFSGSPYKGSFDIRYMRRGFDQTFRAPVRLRGGALGNVRQLASGISTQMGCTITQSDIASAVFPDIPIGSTAKLAVTLDHTSLAYVGDILVEYTRTA